jgi:predicted phage terminase large subunit-like protein
VNEQTLYPALDSVLRRDFMSFLEYAFYELNPEAELLVSPHIEVMASRLEACRQGNVRRMIVNLPPRSLKSHCVTVAFPAWLLGHNPAGQIICASYGQDLADKHARDSCTLILSQFYRRLFPETRLSVEKQAVSEFITTVQGFRMATSVGGVLTGRGADIIIIDDPLKPDEALSETKRTSVNEWYDNTLLSRLNNKESGIIIIVMQRLHQDDLVGHVLEQGNWELISFPAIAEEDETHDYEDWSGPHSFIRKKGDVLHPERESLATLMEMRKRMGEYNFQSQYQQSPAPPGGAMVKTKWLQYYDVLPERFWFVVQSWDTANKSGELNDYSVCTTWGVYDCKRYLLDVFRQRLNFPELKRAVCAQAAKFSPNWVVIEDKASGTQLLQDLRRDVFGLKPYQPPSGSDKLMRFFAQTAEFENGRALLPRSAPWLDDYVKEITSFPGSKYDDQVDSTAQALDYLNTHRSLEIWARL